jgi:hypothetical protein
MTLAVVVVVTTGVAHVLPATHVGVAVGMQALTHP